MDWPTAIVVVAVVLGSAYGLRRHRRTRRLVLHIDWSSDERAQDAKEPPDP